MVVYGLALGNQRQLNGGDFSTLTDELWPPAAGLVHAAAIDTEAVYRHRLLCEPPTGAV